MTIKTLLDLLVMHNTTNKGYLIHLNSDNVETTTGKNTDVEFSDICFSNCQMINEKLLAFNNINEEPISHLEDGTPIYHMSTNSNMYINLNKINSIEDVEDKKDCFSMPTGKVVNLYMSYENIITIGFME
jgi:hypothetical protein